MKYSKFLKACLLILLIIAYTIIFLKIKNDLTALYALVSLLFILLLVQITLKRYKKVRRDKIISYDIKRVAHIISVKKFGKNSLVLQLFIENQDRNYYTSHIIKKANEQQMFEYIKGARIAVFVNPKNEIEVILAEDILEKSSFQFNWSGIFLIIFWISIFAVPVIIENLNNTSEYFAGNEIIKQNDQKYQFWELKVRDQNQLLIKVYDPVSKKELISIQDKKDFTLSAFNKIEQQKDKVFILDDLNNLYIDVYDVRTFKKVMDIKQFEQSKPFLNKGITWIRKLGYKAKFLDEDYYELSCTDGNRYFYNISQDRVFNSDTEMGKYFYRCDSVKMSRYMYTFALLPLSGGEKFQLGLIEAASKKNLDKLIEYAGDPSIDIRFFMDYSKVYPKWEQPVYKVEKKPTLKTFSDTLAKATFAYFDFDLALIEHKVNTENGTNYQFTGFDKNGKIVFSIEQNQFPNVKKMLENSFLDRADFYYKIKRDNNNFIITFKNYGSICMDLKTGKQLWKFEP